MSDLTAELAVLRAEVAQARQNSLAAEDRLAAVELNAQLAWETSRAARRQMRVTWVVSSLVCLLTFILGFSSQSHAQFGVTLTSLNNAVLALQSKTASMSVLTDPNTSEPTVRFSGVNVQVVSGSGSTSGTTNGTGNLIVGYNEPRGDDSDSRTGSHNLIVGMTNNYSSFGGTVVGQYNTISGQYASVSGGLSNTASGGAASVSGGEFNTASSTLASVSGGYGNAASGPGSSVSGGDNNTASGYYASVSGGTLRTVSAEYGWSAGSQAGSALSGNFSSP